MTIKDISALTGYSVGTVSRVLNNQPNVSDRARQAILSAAQSSGFQINTNAQQLKQQRTNAILVVVKGISNELFGPLLEELQNEAVKWPYSLIVDHLDEDENEVLRGVQLCREKKPRGIIFLGGNLKLFQADFQDVDLPCVLVTGDAEKLGLKNLSSITTDDHRMGFLAVEHLAKLGHKRLAIIGGQRNVSDITDLRYAGALEAAEHFGMDFNPEQDYFGGRFSYAEGYHAAQALLKRCRPFTSIFAMSDVMAIGAIRALNDNGLRVPQDVSVIGIDGLAIGDYCIPRLTTCRQSVGTLARRCAQMLMDQIQDGVHATYEVIPPVVEWKESTRPM